jgi:hypothetical protein
LLQVVLILGFDPVALGLSERLIRNNVEQDQFGIKSFGHIYRKMQRFSGLC